VNQQEVSTSDGVPVVNQFPSTKEQVPAKETPEAPESGSHSRQGFYIFDPEQAVKAPEVYYEGFLEAEEMAVWLGREKSRKSSVLLQFAFSAALGRPLFDIPFSHSGPLRVTIFDFESKKSSMKERWERLAAAMDLTAEERQRLRENLKIVLLRESVAAGGLVPRFTLKPDSAADQYWRDAVRENPADLFIIDPFRNFHSENENDSTIEALLAKIRRTFGKAAIVIAHHMVKRSMNQKENVKLTHDMRLFSDGGRGSGAIKGYCDIIITQEWSQQDGEEIVHWGAFGKNIADLSPRALVQTGPNSGLWVPTDVEGLSQTVRASLRTLKEHRESLVFENRAEAAGLIMGARTLARSTANEHVDGLLRKGLITVEKTKGQPKSPRLTFTPAEGCYVQ
jgi:hypothetical protein